MEDYKTMLNLNPDFLRKTKLIYLMAANSEVWDLVDISR